MLYSRLQCNKTGNYLERCKAQSAVEYLITYGWMLLAVAIIGGTLFSVTLEQSAQPSGELSGGDISLEDIGVTTQGLDFILRNTAAERINVKQVNLSDGEGITSWNGDKQISSADTGKISLEDASNISDGDLDMNVRYDVGGLSNLESTGTVTEYSPSSSDSDDLEGPTASASSNTSIGEENKPIEFDGFESSPGDSSVENFEWDFNDGNTATGETVTHEFEENGEYNVELTVTDEEGNKDSDTISITIEEAEETQESFIMRVNGGESFEIMTGTCEEQCGDDFNYSIQWENIENSDQNGEQHDITGNYEITFEEQTEHEIKINGSLPHLKYDRNAEASKIQSIEQWGSIEWQSMENTFAGAENMRINAEDSPNLENVTDVSWMLRGTDSIQSPDLNHWDTSNVENMQGLFYRADNFNGDITQWNTSNAKKMDRMFRQTGKFNQDIGGWNTSNVNDMSWMFYIANDFNQNLSDWDTSNVNDMSYMFARNNVFNGKIGEWDTTNVETMRAMFSSADSFNQDVSEWETHNVKDMAFMFRRAENFNGDVSNWNTSNVQTMRSMFDSASQFDSNISNWDTSNVEEMPRMFRAATSFDQDISGWDTGNVESMVSMFEFTEFDQNIGGWNTSNVNDMSRMFRRADFNQDISDWNTSNVNNMDQMFEMASIFDQDISRWCVEQIEFKPDDFDTSSGFEGEAEKQPDWGEIC